MIHVFNVWIRQCVLFNCILHCSSCLLDELIEALEDSRRSEGVQLDLLDCRIIMMRAEVESMKGSILVMFSFPHILIEISYNCCVHSGVGGVYVQRTKVIGSHC